MAEGVVGATFGVIHARLLELRPEPLVELLGSLMATIVLPYRGSAAAARELGRPVPKIPARRRDGDGLSRRPVGAASPVDYRLTVRTQMALAAVAGRPGLNNREVSEIIGLADQGQISRMMKRLSDQGLVENTQAHTKRLARAWRLTADGEAVIDAHRPLKQAQRRAGKGGKLVPAKSGRRGKHEQTDATAHGRSDGGAGTGFRMTVAHARGPDRCREPQREGGQPEQPRYRAAPPGSRTRARSQSSSRAYRPTACSRTPAAVPAGGNAWQLTSRGGKVLAASRPGKEPVR